MSEIAFGQDISRELRRLAGSGHDCVTMAMTPDQARQVANLVEAGSLPVAQWRQLQDEVEAMHDNASDLVLRMQDGMLKVRDTLNRSDDLQASFLRLYLLPPALVLAVQFGIVGIGWALRDLVVWLAGAWG